MKLHISFRRPNIDTEYQRIIEFVSGSFPMSTAVSPTAKELFDFMFHTENVSANVADQSEKLLKEIMDDSRMWAWTEVDYSKIRKVADKIGRPKLVGALGVGAEDTDLDVLDLTGIHEKWNRYRKRKKDDTVHPLKPILEAWYAIQEKT